MTDSLNEPAPSGSSQSPGSAVPPTIGLTILRHGAHIEVVDVSERYVWYRHKRGSNHPTFERVPVEEWGVRIAATLEVHGTIFDLPNARGEAQPPAK